MDEDYSKGHPTNPSNDTDLIEYEQKVDFLRKGNDINLGLILRGTLKWMTWWEPFGSESKETPIPNTPWDDRIIDIKTPANTIILGIIRGVNDAVNNTKSDEKSDITIDNIKITATDNSGNKILDPNYDLMRINNSSLKELIKVKTEQGFTKFEVPKANYIIYKNSTKQITRLPPKEDDKTIIIGIEFSIYKNESGIQNPGAISRLSGIYKTDYLNVYNPNRWMAEVENSTITNEEFKYINKNYIMDIDFTDGGVGDKKNTSEKILIKGEKGYALSGIQYVYNLPTGEQEPYKDVFCDKPIRQIVFAFDSIYNENKPTLYHYINNGTPSVSQQNPLPIDQCYSYNMGSSRNNRLFISNFDVFYNIVPDDEDNLPKWLKTVAEVVNMFKSAPWDWKFDIEEHDPGDLFAGIKGIMSVQTISIKNRVIYDWIKDIDYLKCCDTQIDNLYDPDTIEEQYGRYEKDYYITTSKIPSDSCFSDILTPYCNNYYKLEYTVDFGVNEIEKIIFRIDNKSENIDNKSLKSVIMNKINNILPPGIRCFNISSNIFTDVIIIDFTIKDPPIRYIDFKILNAQNNNEFTVELTDEKKILEEDRCKNYCSFNNTNCDNTIKKYCLNERDIEGEEGLFIKTKIKFFPKFYTIPNFNKEIEVYLPNQKRIFLEDKICGCFMSSYKEHKIELTNFYNDIKTEYQSKLNTANATNKELINKEIENINYLIKTLDLYDSEQSFKNALDLQLQNKRLLENYKTECMFPPCLKNPFKMKSMKNTICTAPQSCIGNGFAVPELGNDVTINCNKEKGILDLNCVIVNNKLEPKFILLSDFKNYNNCKDTYQRIPPYSEIDKPSYCKIGAAARELGCENVNGRPLMKNVFDITTPQYPLDNKSLCPPPKDKLPRRYPSYYNSSVKCKEPEVKPTPPNVKYLIFGIVSIIILIFFIFLLLKYKWSVSR